MARRNTTDFGEAVGAREFGSAQVLTVYIPSRDRDGVEFDNLPWIEEALRLLARIGGGATALPPADGAGWTRSEMSWSGRR